MRGAFVLPLAAAVVLTAAAALASVPAEVVGRGQDPDWPCIQRKVPELSVAAVWQGPPVEEALAAWRDDPEVAALARTLAARRTTLDEAREAIAGFAADLPADEKERKLTLLFAGIFTSLDGERSDVMAGIERYGRKQKAMADKIRADQARLSELAAAAAGADPAQAQALTNQLIWETRIFNERRNSLTYVCEVPTLIEQRLFELARTIQNELTG
jgi:hypothetical protein